MCRVSADLIAGPFDVAQDALRAFEQLVASLGQAYAAVGAGEERGVELVLQSLHVPR